jgi:hypothetical protein
MKEKSKQFIKKLYNGWCEGMEIMGKVEIPFYFDIYEPTVQQQLAMRQLIEEKQKKASED